MRGLRVSSVPHMRPLPVLLTGFLTQSHSVHNKITSRDPPLMVEFHEIGVRGGPAPNGACMR